MKNSTVIVFAKLILIGITAGIVLIIPLKVLYEFAGNTAYILLFNFDYIPVLNQLRPVKFFGYIFHFVTCISSVIGLFYILKIWQLQHKILLYVLVYSIGGAGLFFLTALSPQFPEANDRIAWLYWTLAHGLFGFTVGYLVNRFLRKT